MADKPITENAGAFKVSYTRGPWFVVPYGDGDSLVVCSDQDGEWRICFMATPGGSPDVWQRIQANAHLISAAPDLLEALEGADILVQSLLRELGISDHIVFPEGGSSIHSGSWLKRTRVAIAKAHGMEN